MFRRILPGLLLTAWPLLAGAEAYQSQFVSIDLSPGSPAFSAFQLDSLGSGRFPGNPVLADAESSSSIRLSIPAAARFEYRDQTPDGKTTVTWTVQCHDDRLELTSHYTDHFSTRPFGLKFDQKLNHATLLGMMKPGDRRIALPAVLHLPDMGSAVITCDEPGQKLIYDARRYVKPSFVDVQFPAATREHPVIRYSLKVKAFYPDLKGAEQNPLYAAYRRDFLNIFQVNPRLQMLANNSSSDPVPFTLFKYAEIAAAAPPLTDSLTCLDLIRMTLEQYLSGVKGYGMKDYAVTPVDADLVPWKTPHTSLDTTPSLLLAACTYVEAAKDERWAKERYESLAGWAREIMAGDKDGNGLIEYPRTGNLGDRPTPDNRPANWWDTINFGHEDAYSNALAYRALEKFAMLAANLGHSLDGVEFSGYAVHIKDKYTKTFLNPETGVLAGWRSADGKLHDYWFTFISGAAITYGLVDDVQANSILDKLLKKMEEVGYTNFRLGLPGNLIPVVKADYCYSDWPNALDTGEPKQDDGLDAFQRYENGGATGCFSYFLIKALYRQGRVEDARRIFHPMLQGYAAGEFQGFCADGKSRDWRDWKGNCFGYEGLLVDNYLPLLAVIDDVKHKASPKP